MTEPSISTLYRAAVGDAISLFGSLEPGDWSTPVPCTPAWTVRDVLSHVSGVADDITNGRVEGAASDPWTAAQVERYRNDSVDHLLTRWADQLEAVADLLESIGEQRPFFDCCTHEHDLRHALGRPGNRSSTVIGFAAGQLVDTAAQAGITVQTVEADGAVDRGGPDPAVAQPRPGNGVEVRGITDFELFRSRIGRRSRNQVAAYDWSGADDDIQTAIDRWFVFGPAADDIVE